MCSRQTLDQRFIALNQQTLLVGDESLDEAHSGAKGFGFGPVDIGGVADGNHRLLQLSNIPFHRSNATSE
jgi:hypothetical protein